MRSFRWRLGDNAHCNLELWRLYTKYSITIVIITNLISKPPQTSLAPVRKSNPRRWTFQKRAQLKFRRFPMWWSHEDERWLLFIILYRTMMTKSLWNVSKQATFYPRGWARLSYRLTMIKGNFLYWVFLFNQIWKDQEQALLVIISQTLFSRVLLLMITKDDIQIKIITQSSATAVCVKSIFWQNLFLGAAQSIPSSDQKHRWMK